MTWNNYLQSLDRWIQDLSFRDSTADLDVDTAIHALAQGHQRGVPGRACNLYDRQRRGGAGDDNDCQSSFDRVALHD
jgi:hypothetical protein